jgi:tetratricopeptide (TPR) repeat protein
MQEEVSTTAAGLLKAGRYKEAAVVGKDGSPEERRARMRALVELGESEDLLAALEEGSALLEEEGDDYDRGLTSLELAAAMSALGDEKRAAELLADAEAMLKGRAGPMTRVLVGQGEAAYEREAWQEALELAERAGQQVEEEDLEGRALVLNLRSLSLGELGHTAEAGRLRGEEMELTRRHFSDAKALRVFLMAALSILTKKIRASKDRFDGIAFQRDLQN